MLAEKQVNLLNQYNASLALYKGKKWAEAKAGFLKALEIDPQDGPSKMYLARCEEYIKNPPGDDWDGVFVMKTK